MGYRICALIFVLACGAVGCPVCPLPAECPVVLPPEADPNVAPDGVEPSLYAAMDAAAQACLILKMLKCPEADAPDCPADVRKLVELGTFEPQNVTCIRSSRTVTRIRTCSVDCVRP